MSAVHRLPGSVGEYRINIQQFTAELGVSAPAVRHMVGLGHATWNQSGRTGYFVHIGSTPVEDGDELCTTSGDWNLVTMMDDQNLCEDGRGFAIPVCNDTRWWLNICPDNPWSTHGTPGTNQIDIVQTLAHEFGHATALPHPNLTACANGLGAVMCPTGHSNHRTRQRDIYPWDIECSHEAGGPRDVGVVAIAHVSGNFLSPIDVPPTNTFKGHPTVRWGASNEWSRVGHSELGQDLRLQTNPSMTATTPTHTVGVVERAHAPSLAWWPERPDELRHYYHRVYEGTGMGQVYAPRQTRFAHDLSGGGTLEWLYQCVPTPWSSCASITAVRTDQRLAHAYNDATQSSVTAWVEKNRADKGADHTLRISPGVYLGQPNVLRAPAATEIRTSIPPAVACKEGQAAEGFDCMLAYVDFDTGDGLIRHRMFTINPDDTFTWRSQEFVTVHRTSQGVALWYHDDSWWRAQVHAVTQDVHVYRSSDGLGWIPYDDLGFSVQVPAAASHHTTSFNFIFLTR